MPLNGYEEMAKVVPVGDIDADGDAKDNLVLLVPAGRRFTLDQAHLSAEATVSAADTNYNTFFLRDNLGNELCRLENGDATNGTDITHAPVEMGTGTGAAWTQGSYDSQYVEVGNDSSDEYLSLQTEKTGNGLAVPGLTVILEGRWTK